MIGIAGHRVARKARRVTRPFSKIGPIPVVGVVETADPGREVSPGVGAEYSIHLPTAEQSIGDSFGAVSIGPGSVRQLIDHAEREVVTNIKERGTALSRQVVRILGKLSVGAAVDADAVRG